MDEEKKSLYQRIRNARKSLENAEKSFQDDKGMRGELDLMLAEAEIKNLRNKQTFPWSWNRNLLACCFAVLLAVAGVGGWFFARGNSHAIDTTLKEPITNVKVEAGAATAKNNVEEASSKQANSMKENNNNLNIKNTETGPDITTSTKVQLSEKDMRSLVRKAKTELSSGK